MTSEKIYSVGMYADTTGLFTDEECDFDNGYVMDVPESILRKWFELDVETATQMTLEDWLNEYTWDETIGLYQFAVKEMRDWLNANSGTQFEESEDGENIVFYYTALHNMGLSLLDTDEWVWLNTLFGYNIGWNNAKEIINFIYEDDGEVLDWTYKNKDEAMEINKTLNLSLDFSKWATEEPKICKYFN